LPHWGTEIFVDNITYRVGGNLSNLALPLKKVGINPIIIGNIGDDNNGKYILNSLNNSGFDTSLIKIEEKTSTSTTIALVREDGERTFLTYPGQLNLVTRGFINNHINKIQKNSIVILCSLFQFPNLKITDVINLFKKLKEKKCTTLLDTGWDSNNWNKKTISDIKKLLKFVDIFLPNLDEAKVITNLDNEKEILNHLKNIGTKNIIIKKGPKGSIALFKNKIIESNPYPATCIDATGAGDAFNAAIIYCLKKGMTFINMLDFANATASLTISKLTNRYPNINDINAVIKNK